MRRKLVCHTAGAILVATAWATAAQAQAGGDLMAMDVGSLRGEIQSRYADALGLTQQPAVISADTSQFIWASQAKAQCGIALGFLRSHTKDPVSIGKCADAAARMHAAPPVVMAAPAAPTALPERCSQPLAGIIFFEWDSSVVPDSAGQTLDSIVSDTKTCGWTRLTVTGHTDRSGSDAYNMALSLRRANAVAAVLEARGEPQGVLNIVGKGESEPKVPTPDGERNPTNRRVELSTQ